MMGLNRIYDQTRSHILILKLIPNIKESFNIIAQDYIEATSHVAQ